MIRRQHPRRRAPLQVIRHAPPEEALAAMAEPATGPLPAVLEEEAADVSRETSAQPWPVDRLGRPIEDGVNGWVDPEPLPPLRPAQVARLEALTAAWEREVRVQVPPDATMLYAAPRPPVPPPSRPEPPVAEPPAAVDEAEAAEASRRLLEEETAHDTAHALEVARRLEDLRPEPAPYSLEEADALRDTLATEVLPARRVTDWASRHDPRSLAYPVADRLSVSRVPLQDVLLERGPILDQGTTPPLSLREASGCVGFAVTAAANALDAETRTRGGTYPEFRDVEDARAAYHLAQTRDQLSGEDYAGTSVLAGMKAGQELGWWETYLWALRGPRDVAQALLQLHSPVVIGIPWDTSLEEPDAAGVIRPGGRPAGGHALAVVGLRMTLPGQAAGPYFVLQQSRGPAEGVGGLVYLHHRDLAALLAGQGEAAVPLSRWPQ